MKPAVLGAILVVIGLLMIGVGLQQQSSTSSPLVLSAARESLVAPPSTSPATSPSVTISTTTTTTSTTTTTTLSSRPDVAGFITQFAALLAAADTTQLTGLLHPAVIDGFGEQLCRAWVEREILLLNDYTAAGEIGEPSALTVQTPNGPVDIDEVWQVPVSFVFNGESLGATAQIASLNGELRWLGQCR